MFFGGAGSAGGWSGGGSNWNNNLRPNTLKRSGGPADGWDDDELGSVYNHRVVVRLSSLCVIVLRSSFRCRCSLC